MDCIDNPIIGKGWPRGGGVWDQDPMLVKHFRLIRDYKRNWEDSQETVRGAGASGGDGGPLGSALDQYIEKLQGDGESTIL